MKVNGVELTREVLFGPITFKRGDSFVAFYAQPVWDLDEFYLACPVPKNDFVRFEKGGKVADPDHPAYREKLAQWHRKRWGYVTLKTLEPSNIEFDNISLDDPETWVNVEAELKANLGLYEFAQVSSLVDEANALDAEKLEENAKSFFQQRESALSAKADQKDEAENSKPSELAKDSE